jgi:hypothetical protein
LTDTTAPKYVNVRKVLRPPLIWWRHQYVSTADSILAEYPKSGSTWLTFMLGEAIFGEPLSWDNERLYVPPVGRKPDVPPIPGTSGRLMKTHERYRAEYRKSVYLVRHVSDVAVSMYNARPWASEGSFKLFLQMFLEGRVDSYGPWQDHVNSWLDAESKGADILVVSYEDLRADTEQVLLRILQFLGVEGDRRAVSIAVAGNEFGSMRRKEDQARTTVPEAFRSTSRFVRKGVVGDSLEWLDPEDWMLVEATAGPALERLGYGLRPPRDPGVAGSLT